MRYGKLRERRACLALVVSRISSFLLMYGVLFHGLWKHIIPLQPLFMEVAIWAYFRYNKTEPFAKAICSLVFMERR